MRRASSPDVERLEREVESIYREVAEASSEDHHFETGRTLAERLDSLPEDPWTNR